MGSLLVLRVHLHHDAGAVISEVNGILLVETDTYDIAIPTDPLVLVHAIKLSDSLVWIVHE